jgi:hypothetical protein
MFLNIQRAVPCLKSRLQAGVRMYWTLSCLLEAVRGHGSAAHLPVRVNDEI